MLIDFPRKRQEPLFDNCKKTLNRMIKFSKNLQEMKKELESHFSLFLEGHTSTVTSVTVTSDNKYIISGSSDETIRI